MDGFSRPLSGGVDGGGIYQPGWAAQIEMRTLGAVAQDFIEVNPFRNIPTVVVVDDVLPEDIQTAARPRGFATGAPW